MSDTYWFGLGVGVLAVIGFILGGLLPAISKRIGDGKKPYNPWFQLTDFDLCNTVDGSMYIWCRKCDTKAVPHVLTGDAISSLVTVCLEHTHVVAE